MAQGVGSPDQPAPHPTPNTQRARPWGKIALGLGIVVIILIGWLAMGTVTINAAPDADRVTISGKKGKIGAQKHMPGQLKIKIEKDGYLTYDKTVKLGFHGRTSVNPVLKKLPVASLMSESVTGPIIVTASGQGAQGISADRQRIVRSIYQKNPSTTVSDQSSNESPTFITENLNLNPLPAISSLQYPSDQRYALITAQSGEIGILDFSRREVTSQDYAAFGVAGVKSIALSPDGQEVFYWQLEPSLGKNFLIRDNIRHEKPDRYFDQPLIDQLGVTKLNFRWSPDAQKILGLGEKTILIDILARKASILTTGSDLASGWFSADSKTIIALTANGQLKTINIETRQATDHDITTSADKVVLGDNNTLFIHTNDNQFISYNFDTKEKVGYLIDASIASNSIAAIAVDSKNTLVYFVADNKLYTQPLVRGDYIDE
jgi:hypothetical protein